MTITYTSYTDKLKTLLRRRREERLRLPDHQRDYVWSDRQQVGLIRAIRRGKPIPSILLRELEDGTMSLEDGHQRLKTLLRYVDNEFPDDDGGYFRDLSEDQQQRFYNYDIIVVKYSDATDVEAREIFNDFQNGKPLTFGERIYSMRAISPIVGYAVRRFLTPGTGFYERLSRITGAGRTPKGRRGADMARAFSLCAGVAFGINHLSRKWDDAEMVLPRDINEDELDSKFLNYIRIMERVNELSAITTNARRNEYWDPGNFSGYIIFTLLIHGTDEATKFNLPQSMDELREAWAQHIVAVHHDPSLHRQILLADLTAARSWNRARWANGVRRLFVPDDNTILEDYSDDDDASE
jgi:hypothetical protein